jgi:predicted CXXCH cytochrome family protein
MAQLSVNPDRAVISSGDSAIYSLRITNMTALTTTVALTATDSLPIVFDSILSNDLLTLGPKASDVVTLTVNASGQKDVTNETRLRATINGIERARATVITQLTLPRLNRAISGIGVSDHFVPPATRIEMSVGITTTAPLTSVVLADVLPRAWTIEDARGGTVTIVNTDTQKIEWRLGDLTAGALVTKTYALTSPAGEPDSTHTFTHQLVTPPQSGEPWRITLAHPLRIARYRALRGNPLGRAPNANEPAPAIPRFEAFRVRFQIVNDHSTAVQWKPRLEWSARADGGFELVPLKDAKTGKPFYIRPLDEVADGQTILAANLETNQDNRARQDGIILTERNVGPVLALKSTAYTEIEFSLRATAETEYNRAYYFRLVDDTRHLRGAPLAVMMDAVPMLELTQPQYPGLRVNDPSAAIAPSSWRAALSQPQQFLRMVAPTASSPQASAPAAQLPFPNPHGGYTATSDWCARCHRDHTGKNGNLLPNAPAQSNLCFGCHNGSGSNKNIASHYSDANVPANNATTSSFYSHAATTPSTHSAAHDDEFRGVLNRHNECSDCHNAHSVDGTLATSTTSGWRVSGALKNISGVGVTNGAAGAIPTFAWKSSITYEYELCLKCHSSYTTLLSYTKESYKKWNKGQEFNPNNPSTHPIEGAGKNTTAAMTANLAGTSPYKLWTFSTSGVMRCVHCHGDYRLATPASPPAAGARLAPHANPSRGNLMNNYRDRVLKSSGQAYAAADFALCLQCHAEAPFRDTSGNTRSDTNFRYHGLHVSKIPNKGNGGTDIDTAGAGQGNAICAECHFRIHGQGPNARGNSTGSRLVNFALNVVNNSNGQLAWNGTTRSCNLQCHSEDHRPETY